MSVTDPLSSTSYSDVARGASSLVWANPNYASVGSPSSTDAGFLPGLSSHWLAGAAFVPVPPIPAGSSIDSLTLRARHRRTSVGSFPTLANLSAVESPSYSASPAQPLTTSFADYDVSLPVGVLTLADVNAGIAARIAYDAVPGATDLDPSHYSVSISPSGTQSFSALGSISRTQNFAVTVTYVGTGNPAPRASVSLTGSAQGSGQGSAGPPAFATSYTGSATVSNGLGDTDSGSIQSPTSAPPPEFRAAQGTHSVAVVVGSPYAVAMTASATVSPPSTQDAVVSFSLAAGAVTPLDYDPSTVELESLLLIVGYTAPEPPIPSVVRPDFRRLPSLNPSVR